MKHIKIYEEYTDDEIKGLIGDLDKVGHYKIPFVIEAPMSEKQKDTEEKAVEMWSFKDPAGDLKIKSGKLVSPSQGRVILSLEITNGDKVVLVKELGGFIFSVNGGYPDQLQGDRTFYSGSSFYPRDYTYSYVLDALERYSKWLAHRINSVQSNPGQEEKGLLQKIKSKFGLEESYSDDELRDLMGDLSSVGHHKVQFDVVIPDYPETEETEIKRAEAWTSKVYPKVFLTKVEGTIGEERIKLEFYFSNGKRAEFSSYYEIGPILQSAADGDYAYFMINGRKYDVKEKFFGDLESGSVIGSCLGLYDEIAEKENL